MGHTNSTANYNLPQFVGTDKPTWLGDINNAFSDIDAAIASAASTATTADGKADALGTTVSGHTTQIGTLSNTVTAQGNTLNTVTALIGNGTPTTTDQTIIGAINELADIVEAGDVSVTADGVKTYSELFTSLYGLVNTSKISERSKMVLTSGTNKFVFDISSIKTGELQFTRLVVTYSFIVFSDYIVGSTSSAYSGKCNVGGAIEFTNEGTDVPTNGNIFTIIY